MCERGRIIANARPVSRPKCDPAEEVAVRLREIRGLCDSILNSLEWGDVGSASRKLNGVKSLVKQALELQGRPSS